MLLPLLRSEIVCCRTLHHSYRECPEGDATFSVHKVDEMPKAPHVSIYFEVDELDPIVDSLIAKEISFDELPNNKPWRWREAG